MCSDDQMVPAEKLDRRGTSLIAAAIVHQAIKDWRNAKETLQKVPGYVDALETVRETERFFRSDWYQTLREFAPDVIPVDIMEVLNR